MYRDQPMLDLAGDRSCCQLSVFNLDQLAFRKFHLFTALLGMDLIGLIGEMSDGICCDLGN